MTEDLRSILARPFSIKFNDELMTGEIVDALELKAATRALRLLREAIGWERMFEILRPMIEESEERWADLLKQADGRFSAPPSYFEVSGLSVDYFLPWVMRKIELDEFNWYMHPEHFVWSTIDKDFGQYKAGDKLVVEPWGSIMHHGALNVVPPESIDTHEAMDDNYPVKFAGVSYFPDGSLKKTVFYQWKPTETGFVMKCAGASPAVLPHDVREGLKEHLKLEWCKALQLARREAENER
ncbi:hypothetical protein [Sphingobium sp.]|uniref:hypothetical protein n=1 Tax=Sphingobium sp. TaxID=1912891 RepID=UPI0028BE9250|nr:hypothetical protein [Sphingobium sp.]